MMTVYPLYGDRILKSDSIMWPITLEGNWMEGD